jgi:hypothetical protein
MPAERASYELITFIATLHHMDLAPALRRARELVAPGGELFIVGVSARKTPTDWIISGLQVSVVRVLSRWRREVRNIGVVVAEPRRAFETFAQSRDASSQAYESDAASTTATSAAGATQPTSPTRAENDQAGLLLLARCDSHALGPESGVRAPPRVERAIVMYQ